MRYITGGIALGAALVLGALAPTAQAAAPAEPARAGTLYAPTALVLAVSQGEGRTNAAVQRAVTLSCTPSAAGSHPDAAAACTQLRSVDGEFNAVTGDAHGRVCTREWNPVTVTADGVWQGHRVSYTHTFANSCELAGGKGAVFDF